MRRVFTYLIHTAHRMVSGEHDASGKFLTVAIGGQEYRVEVDLRDRRALVVFDGDIPAGGLPRAADVIFSEDRPALEVHKAQLRESRTGEDPHLTLRVQENTASVPIIRRFVLLPAGKAVFRRYRDRSLSPQYCLASVRMTEAGPVVEWQTTSG